MSEASERPQQQSQQPDAETNAAATATATASNGSVAAISSNTSGITNRTLIHGDSRSGYEITPSDGPIEFPLTTATAHANEASSAAGSVQPSQQPTDGYTTGNDIQGEGPHGWA
ncbi:hypothetical protein IAT40_007204 [Kwoniella sp. CBS 6097]